METPDKILDRWKGKTVAACIKIVASLVQKSVRMKHADDNGMCICCTCGVEKHYTELDAGHFVSRKFKNTIFDERNIRPQCQACNRFKNGEPAKYAIYLKEEIGEKEFFKLLYASQEPRKFTKEELAKIAYAAKLEIRKHEHRLGLR